MAALVTLVAWHLAAGSEPTTPGAAAVAASSPNPTPNATFHPVSAQSGAVPGTQKWALATGGVVQTSPAVSADGPTVFVGSNDFSLYAVNTGATPPAPAPPPPSCTKVGCVPSHITKKAEAKRQCCYGHGHSTYKCKGSHWRCETPVVTV